MYLLMADGESGGEVYCAAGDRAQASLVYNTAKEMYESSKKLEGRLEVFKRTMFHEESMSKYEVLSADAPNKHGLNASGIIIDELHVQPNRDLVDVLVTSTGAREQPLTIMITTAGYDRNSICWEYHEYARQVIAGTIKDETFLGVIYAADEKDNWEDEKTWKKANPSLGHTISLEYLRNEFKKAKEIPAYQNTFRRLHLNQWCSQSTRFIDMAFWNASAGVVNKDELQACICYGGLDLASTIDIAAFALVFPPEEEGQPFKVLPFFWIPGDNITEKIRRDKVPYDVWVKQGYIKATPGNVIDYGFIRAEINRLKELYNIQEIAYDPWNATQITLELAEEDGMTMVPLRQGFQSMSAPTKELLKLIVSKQLSHGNNPVLNWMVDNVAVKTDPAGNIKPDKALYINTPIPTQYGWTTMGNINIGDILFDETGKPCKVLGTSEIMEGHSCYRIDFSDNTSIIADGGHLWSVIDNKTQSKTIITTTEMIPKLTYNNHQSRYAIENIKPLDLPEQKYVLDPYLLGVWLGDGHSSSCYITCADFEILQEFIKKNFRVTIAQQLSKATTYHIENLTKYLYELGILNNKRIPEGYLRGSIDQRIALLQGLMDTDGHCSMPRGRNGSECVFVNTNENLVDGVCELTNSLGLKPSKRLSLQAEKIGKNNRAWKVSFTAYNDMPIFRLSRKKQRQMPPPDRITRASKRQIKNIVPVDSVPVRCIQVDSISNLFLAGQSMIPTHNSTSTQRIDGVVATIMALDRASRNVNTGSVYEERGLLVI